MSPAQPPPPPPPPQSETRRTGTGSAATAAPEAGIGSAAAGAVTDGTETSGAPPGTGGEEGTAFGKGNEGGPAQTVCPLHPFAPLSLGVGYAASLSGIQSFVFGVSCSSGGLWGRQILYLGGESADRRSVLSFLRSCPHQIQRRVWFLFPPPFCASLWDCFRDCALPPGKGAISEQGRASVPGHLLGWDAGFLLSDASSLSRHSFPFSLPP